MSKILLFVSVAVSTFVVGLWAARGFPVPVRAKVPMEVRIDAEFGKDRSDELKESRRLEAEKDPDDPKRNALRQETLQAATGYTMSPCSAAMKTNLISAATTYAKAYRWRDRCTPALGNCDAVLERANVMYSTSLDLRVRQALHEAFEAGGVSADDFPVNLQMEIMTLANSRGSRASACGHAAGRNP